MQFLWSLNTSYYFLDSNMTYCRKNSFLLLSTAVLLCLKLAIVMSITVIFVKVLFFDNKLRVLQQYLFAVQGFYPYFYFCQCQALHLQKKGTNAAAQQTRSPPFPCSRTPMRNQ